MVAVAPRLSHVHCGDACNHVTNGTWRVDSASPSGAKVLLAQRANRSAWPQPLLDNPRMLKMYGERGSSDREGYINTLVCEDGQLLDEFLKEAENNSVIQVLRDVLVGLCNLHDQGFAHGNVDVRHIVVGNDMKGNLLAPFWCGGAEPVSEALSIKIKDIEKAPPPTQVRIEQDLAAFVTCAASMLEDLKKPVSIPEDLKNPASIPEDLKNPASMLDDFKNQLRKTNQMEFHNQLKITRNLLRDLSGHGDRFELKRRPSLVRAIKRLARLASGKHK